jgi:hypothetical protein
MATDPEKLWKVIIETHKVDCVSSIDAVKELAARKAYQMIKQGAFEMLAQYSERFRETLKGTGSSNGFFPWIGRVQVWRIQSACEEQVGNEVHEATNNGK